MTRITPVEKKVLTFMADRSDEEWFYPFAPIAEETGIDPKLVRRACRSLKRKGLTDFRRGLWTEDGEPAGSGYGITSAGRDAIGDAT